MSNRPKLKNKGPIPPEDEVVSRLEKMGFLTSSIQNGKRMVKITQRGMDAANRMKGKDPDEMAALMHLMDDATVKETK